MPDASINPERDQFNAFKDLAPDAPIDLINLFRLRDRAAYPADHALADAGLTGAEAFVRFAAQSGPVLRRVGGVVVWSGVPELVVIGPADERWDAAYVTHFPRAAAFLEMIADPIYRQSEEHRQAAVATSRLIRCAPRGSDDFAWP